MISDTHKLESILEEDGIVFLTYGGFITQSLIVGMTEALEQESESAELSMKQSTNIFTIFIELAQNMMNYSKRCVVDNEDFNPKGIIIVGKTPQESYYIMSQNIISNEDKEKIEPKLQQIAKSSLDEIKKLYKEARKSGKDTHGKGGGIGFYEIAKRSEKIEYEFEKLNENRFYFRFKALL